MFYWRIYVSLGLSELKGAEAAFIRNLLYTFRICILDKIAELELNHNNVKKVNHNSVKFRDMKHFKPESFIDDLNSCEMFNGPICENAISWDK